MAAQLTANLLSSEAQSIIELIKKNKNFLLSGGAGSGKTYSLVEVIGELTVQMPTARIACITYTNAATQEIEKRTKNINLETSTIHDFLWSTIKHFQVELRKTLLDLINDENNTKIRILKANGEQDKLKFMENRVEYKDFTRLRDGIISHDELLILAFTMYQNYPKIRRIVSDKYSIILVDEYQDTAPLVVSIFLDLFAELPRRNIIGFFGDAMQSIFDDGIGNLNAYVGDGPDKITEVKKEQNRRNPLSVINLANKLRTDNLTQRPSDDLNAPNMGADGMPKQGSAIFLHSSVMDIDSARAFLKWDFSSSETKELNLTHNLIAKKAGFKNLMRIYDSDKILEYVARVKNYIKDNYPDFQKEGKSFGQVINELSSGKDAKELKKIHPAPAQSEYIDQYAAEYKAVLKMPFIEITSLYVHKDMLIDDKKSDQSQVVGGRSNKDDLMKHLFKIQRVLRLYSLKDFNEFIRVTDYKIKSVKDKSDLRDAIGNLSKAETYTIGEVIDLAHANGLVVKDDKLAYFVARKKYIYDQVASLSYSEFQRLFEYIEGYTPFSTQHRTKGREYNCVLVLLDNGNWNSYNFDNFFTGQGKDTVIDRTGKIIYVCCTRARENLALFYFSPSAEVLKVAKGWFGKDNVIDLDAIPQDSKN